jgi:colicin import membrane protein
MNPLKVLPPSALCVLVALVGGVARADVYKSVAADGTVTYTDNLSSLTPERRAYYAKKKEEQEEKRRELEAAIGKEEMARRDAEAKKAELAQQKLADTERARRAVELDVMIRDIEERRRARDAAKAKWGGLMKQARQRLTTALAQFKEVQEKYNNLAMKVSYTLLPGESDEKQKAKEDMERLEKEVDAAILDVDETLPEKARKEGVPPGWLRE